MNKFSVLIDKYDVIHGIYCNRQVIEVLIDAENEYDAKYNVLQDRETIYWGEIHGEWLEYEEPCSVLCYKEGYPKVDVVRTCRERILSVEDESTIEEIEEKIRKINREHPRVDNPS